MLVPNHPFFVPPHAQDSAGVDYLGLRALNLRMTSLLVPGVNNVVTAVRPFSLICWAVWSYEGLVESLEAEPSSTRFERFKQKLETLYVWSHVAAGTGDGLVGNQQKVPLPVEANGPARIPLNFKAVARTGSFLDAAQYGPSLKAPFGLGFIYAVKGNLFKVTDAGRRLAMALDESLQAHLSEAQYQSLRSLDVLDGRLEDWPHLLEAWHVDRPTQTEQQVFQAQLFHESEVGLASPSVHRSTLLFMCREILRNHGEPMSASDLRRSIACEPLPPSLVGHTAHQSFHEFKRRWQVLQVRQAQRLAMEGLFGWVERCLILTDAASVEHLAVLACDSLETEQAGSELLRSRLDDFSYGTADIDELFSDTGDFQGASLFDEMDALEKALTKKTLDDKVVPQCLNMLLRCATFALAFRSDPVANSAASSGEAFRTPLGTWDVVMLRFEGRPVRAFMEHLLGTHIVSQHWKIAASRSADERSRLRFTPEDRGLTSLLGPTQTALSPERAGDRLQHALALLASCGGIKADAPLRVVGSNPLFSV